MGLILPDGSEHGFIDVTSDLAVDLIDEAMKRGASEPVTPTGLPTIDRAMWMWGDRRGIPQGSYVIVGGASNIGKTQMGLRLLKNAAEVGQRAAILSLDMKERDALARIHMALTTKKLTLEGWVPSKWTDEHTVTLRDAVRRYRLGITGDMGIYVGGGRTIEWVKRMIEEGAQLGTTVFVLDHVQKVRVPAHGSDVYSRAEAVSDMLSWATEDLGVTVVALSQLNRQASSQTDRRPTMFDLWGGTSMESNATIVLMLDHSRYERDRERHHLGRTYVKLEKNQLGPKGFSVAVEWNHATLALREAEDDEIGLWPGQSTTGNGHRRRGTP